MRLRISQVSGYCLFVCIHDFVPSAFDAAIVKRKNRLTVAGVNSGPKLANDFSHIWDNLLKKMNGMLPGTCVESLSKG